MIVIPLLGRHAVSPRGRDVVLDRRSGIAVGDMAAEKP
jgi:hypothetical protein